MTSLKRDPTPWAWARVVLLLAWGSTMVTGWADPGSGYLARTNLPAPSLRFMAPPLPPIAPLPPLPPTYIPTPKYSADFMAAPTIAAAPQHADLVVSASAVPAQPPAPALPGPVAPPGALVTVPVGATRDLLSYFVSGNPGTNGPSGPPLLFHLPLPVDPAGSPAAGSSRSTYESR